jgi:hypothetical protein
MFGSNQQETPERRIVELERMAQTLTAQVDVVRPLLSDTTRLEALTVRAEAAAQALEARTVPVPLGEGFEGQIDTSTGWLLPTAGVRT